MGLDLTYPLHYPLSFGPNHLGPVLRLNPHFDTLLVEGVYVPPPNRKASDAAPPTPLFYPAPKPTQEDIEFVVQRARR